MTRTCHLCGRPGSRWYVRRRTGACRDTGMCDLRQALNALPPPLTAEQERERVHAIRDRKLAEIRTEYRQRGGPDDGG